MKLAITYTLFAVLSTIANIGSQDLFLKIYSGFYPITVSIFIGTGVGLVVKYVLDKKYIFQYQTRDRAHDTHTFILYTIMGILTTVIFLSFEVGFEVAFQTKEMRYLGGVIGLAIGYSVKYQLDKRYVFVV
jgi:putative flippase GtrA